MLPSNAGPANSYLSDYGVTDARREIRNKRIVIAIAGTALLSALLWYYFRTFSEERAVHRFFSNLEAKNFKAAYEQWGCTDAAPCRDYQFEKFMEDWGDKSPWAKVSGVEYKLAEPCGNTVWVTVKHPDQKEEVGLAVLGDSKVITYAHEARCPGVWRFRDFPEKLWAFVKRRI